MCIFLLSGCNTVKTDTNETSGDPTAIPDESTNTPNQDALQNSIEEKHFVLESNGYKLNAVYTYINDGKAHPAVLLIAGSGPITYAETAKNATASSAKGYYYYSASDYYWVSYNQIDTVQNISNANIKTLIINSKFDKQSFDEDLNLWSTLFSDFANISICVYDDISHFGYKIDTTDSSSIYTQVDFPGKIISAFTDFIKGD